MRLVLEEGTSAVASSTSIVRARLATEVEVGVEVEVEEEGRNLRLQAKDGGNGTRRCALILASNQANCKLAMAMVGMCAAVCWYGI